MAVICYFVLFEYINTIIEEMPKLNTKIPKRRYSKRQCYTCNKNENHPKIYHVDLHKIYKVGR